MKKYIRLFVFFLSFTAFLPVQPVFAGPDVHGTGQISGADALKMLIGNSVGFSLVGDVLPIVVDPKKRAAPDLEPYAISAQKAAKWAQPMAVQSNRIDWTTDNPISAKYCATLIIKAPWNPKAVPYVYAKTIDTTELSKLYPYSQMFGQSFEAMASLYGLLRKMPVDGKYNFDWPVNVVTNIVDGDCGMQDPGTPNKSITANVGPLAKFPEASTSVSAPYTQSTSILTRVGNEIVRIVDYVTQSIPMHFILTDRSRMGQMQNVFCFPGRCNGESTDDPRAAKLADNNGSVAGSLLPMDYFKKPIEFNTWVSQTFNVGLRQFPGGKTSVEVNVPYKNANSGIEDDKASACMYTPLKEQQRTVFGHDVDYAAFSDKCKPKPPAQCPIDLIEAGQAKTVPACNLTNAGSYASVSFVNTTIPGQMKKYSDSLPSGIPPLMQKVLNAAGAAYNVPAALLLGTMMEEGAFRHAGTWDWTDENVKKFSDCNVIDPIKNCNDPAFMSKTGAKGPFGFITDPWWKQYMDDGGPYKNSVSDPQWKAVVDKIPKENITQCNFTDAAFMTARELWQDQSHYYDPNDPTNNLAVPPACGVDGTSYNFGIYTRPASCGSWTTDQVALARFQYDDRECTDQLTRMVKTFHGFSGVQSSPL